jgi:ribosomal-protein-alanine N-acetyltransferase
MARRVTVEPVRESDGTALVAVNLASVDLHEPWVYPFRDQAGFKAYLRSCDGHRKIGFIGRENSTRRIVGIVNVSEIIRGALWSAFLGYYGVAGSEGRGMMSEMLGWVVDHSFRELGLHRLEANIQPQNESSIALVRRLGFRKEGFSPRYLKIAGEWRDHERWALLADEWRGPARDGQD